MVVKFAEGFEAEGWEPVDPGFFRAKDLHKPGPPAVALAILDDKGNRLLMVGLPPQGVTELKVQTFDGGRTWLATYNGERK